MMVFFALFLWCIVLFGGSNAADPLSSIILPPGFNIEIFASKPPCHMKQPKEMSVATYNGSTIIYVGGHHDYPGVWALVDYDSDNQIDANYTIYDENTDWPIGAVAIHPQTGQLFMSSINASFICEGNANQQILYHFDSNSRLQCNVWFDLPYYLDHHSTHIMMFHEIDEKSNKEVELELELCFTFAQPCNECWNATNSPPLSTIMCYNPDPKVTTDIMDGTIMATGIRNAVGLDWHPITKQLWFSDNGRDELLNVTNIPDDELNVVSYNGEYFGFPYCHSEGCGDPYQRDIDCVYAVTDPDIAPSNYTKTNCSSGFTLAKLALGPHVAAVGMRFYDPNKYHMFPKQYNNAIFIAEHGSWDRTPMIGYRIVVVLFDPKTNYTQILAHNIFAQGWLNDTIQSVSGRVADLQFLPDGSMIVSDDQANAIYRIYYNATQDTDIEQEQYKQKQNELKEYWNKLEMDARSGQ